MRISYQELYDASFECSPRPDSTTIGLDCARGWWRTRAVMAWPSHGLNLFPRLIAMIRAGVVDVHARPVRVSAAGALERWDGQRGIGNLNAHASMDAAIALARVHGIGCVALANTNHWMRGGAFGWQAAEAGVIGLCWTNTLPNLPPWGDTVPRVGNNPLASPFRARAARARTSSSTWRCHSFLMGRSPRIAAAARRCRCQAVTTRPAS